MLLGNVQMGSAVSGTAGKARSEMERNGQVMFGQVMPGMAGKATHGMATFGTERQGRSGMIGRCRVQCGYAGLVGRYWARHGWAWHRAAWFGLAGKVRLCPARLGSAWQAWNKHEDRQ